MLNLIITYIWFGATIPDKYLLQFNHSKFPAQILINPPNNYTYKMDIQKADRHRLQVLRNGGFYCDFDVYFHYQCLMEILEKFDGEMLAPENDFSSPGWSDQVGNFFLYVPENNTSLIRQILENQGKNCTDSQVAECNGQKMLFKYRDRITTNISFEACLGHSFNYTWGKQVQWYTFKNLLFALLVILVLYSSYSTWKIKQLKKQVKNLSDSVKKETSVVELQQTA